MCVNFSEFSMITYYVFEVAHSTLTEPLVPERLERRYELMQSAVTGAYG